MRRGLLAAMSLALLCARLFGGTGSTVAHPITLDGNTTEWFIFGKGPADDNVGHIIRNAQSQGEFAWRDDASDHRVIAATGIYSKEVDLRQVRVTGDGANLSVAVSLGGSTLITPGPTANLPQLQIAIDSVAGGQASFVSPITTTPTLAYPWEYLLKTQFGTGTLVAGGNINQAPLRVYNGTGAITEADGGQGLLNKVDNTIELQVPWSALGNLPAGPLRFTLVIVREQGTLPDPDGGSYNILDTLTPTARGGPTGLANTLDELSDGEIDYAFEVRFDGTGVPTSAGVGDVFSPLLITEAGLFPNQTPNGNGDSLAQWVELTNVSANPISGAVLQTYKIGDAVERDGTEGAFTLPNVTLNSGQSIIVTRDRPRFKTAYGFSDSQMNRVYEFDSATNPSASNVLTSYSAWGNGNFSLRSQGVPPLNDQFVLLDSADTIVDLVEYASAQLAANVAYPDHEPVAISTVPATPSVPGGPPEVALVVNTGMQRCPAARDTNNINPLQPDWVVTTTKADQTPLAACSFADMQIVSKTGPQNIVINVAAPVAQTYVITYRNNRLDAANVVVTDTLPLGMSYVSSMSSAGLPEPQVGTAGQRAQVVWTVGSVAAGASGTISVTTALAANTAPASGLANEVTVSSSTREVAGDLANNSLSLTPINYTTEPVVDVVVTKALLTSGASASKLYPGGTAVYRVTYSNIGAKAASDITLVDTIPAGLTYVSNSKNFTAAVAGGQVTLTPQGQDGALAVGASGVVDLVFGIGERLDASTIIAANTIAIATTTTPELDTTNNSAASATAPLGNRPPTADLQVVKLVKDAAQATPGGSIVYTIAYSNTGEREAFAVKLTDLVPARLEYRSNSARLNPDTSVAGQITFSLPPLLAGDKGTLDITFKVKETVTAGTQVTNQVSISTTSDESPITNNSATAAAVEIKGNTPGKTEYKTFLPVVKRQ